MTLSSTYRKYRPSPRQYIVRFSADKIRTILWYRGRVSARLLSKVFNLQEPLIRNIWTNSYCLNIPLPPGWHPSLTMEKNMEAASISFKHLYLSPSTQRFAIKDINQLRLSPNQKEIVTRILQCESALSVASQMGYTQQWIRQLFIKALVVSFQRYGRREWILLASKGQITFWSRTPKYIST
jgi:hypothetical protein